MLRHKHFYLREDSVLLNNTQLSDKAKESLLFSKSEHTIDAYASDWEDFRYWSIHSGYTTFPPTEETIVNYINDLATYAKANTIARRISAISENLQAAGLSYNPCSSVLVKAALRGIRRMKGTFQQGKTPLLLANLYDIIEWMPTQEAVSPIVQARDKALLLTGFMGAFRRSELCAIRVEDIRFLAEGMEIFIASSKADQEGYGDTVAIPYIPDAQICAVRAVQKWLELTGLTAGPLFRGFRKNHSLREAPLSDRSVSDILKYYITHIGLDPTMYGAHSLRHGFATTAAACGVEERDIMRQTRHHSVHMVRRYINEANRFSNHAIYTMMKHITKR